MYNSIHVEFPTKQGICVCACRLYVDVRGSALMIVLKAMFCNFCRLSALVWLSG